MKICTRCHKELSLDQFNKNNRNKNGLQPFCRQCNSEYLKAHYKNNVPYYVAKAHKRTQQLKQDVYDYLSSHPCIQCGETRVACLQFNHKDPALKSFNVSKGILIYGFKKVWDEIAKCEILCANCHACLTAEQFGWYTGRTSIAQ